jgi:hypothetical protein
VLWVRISDEANNPNWAPFGGYATVADCQKIQQGIKRDTESTPLTPGVTKVSHHCFPDTVDPRGPKGGGR